MGNTKGVRNAVIMGVGLSGLALIIWSVAIGVEELQALFLNVGTELIGALIIYILIDRVIGVREKRERERREKREERGGGGRRTRVAA